MYHLCWINLLLLKKMQLYYAKIPFHIRAGKHTTQSRRHISKNWLLCVTQVLLYSFPSDKKYGLKVVKFLEVKQQYSGTRIFLAYH